MRRIFFILGGLLGGILCLAFVTQFLVFQTTSGKSFIVGQAEAQLSSATASDVAIGSLTGSLPSEIFVRDIQFSADETVWLTIDEIRLDWKPWALFGKKVVVNNGAISGVNLIARPPEKEDKEEKPVKGLILPTSLPSIKIDNFIARDIHIGKAITGHTVNLEGDGQLQIGSRDILAKANINARDGKDAILFSIERDGPSNQLTIDIRAQSQADGLVSTLAGFEEPLSLSLKGDGPVDAFMLQMDSTVGAFADLSGTLSGNLEKLDAVSIEANANLGPNLSDIAAELGESLSLKAELTQQSDDVTFTLDDLTTAAARMTATARWQNRGDALATASLESTIMLNDTAFNGVSSLLGKIVDLRVALSPDGNTYSLSAETSSEKGQLLLENAETDLQSVLNGPLSVTLFSSDNLPVPFADGATVTTALAFQKDKAVKLDDIALTTDNGFSVTGDAALNIEENSLLSELNLALQPNFLTALVPSLSAEAPLTSSLSLNGKNGRIDVTLNGRSPVAALNDNTIPPHVFSVAVEDITAAPNGTIALSSQELGTVLNGIIRTTSDGIYQITDFDYAGSGFSFAGNGQFSPETGLAQLNASYNGAPGSEFFPGVTLIGAFKADATRSEDGAIALDLAIPSLRLNETLISGATFTASGPEDAIAIVMNARDLSTGAGLTLTQSKLLGVASVADGFNIKISTLSTRANSIDIETTSPFILTTKDGVAVQALAARIGLDGSIAGDINFRNDRWVAKIAASDIIIPDYATSLMLNLDLDTNRDAHAIGQYAVTSIIDENKSTLIAGALNWQDNQITLKDDASTEGLALDLALPAKLTRSTHLSIDTAGTISGKAAYNGPIAPFTTLGPSTVQSLEGNLEIDVDISGSLDAPVIDGGFSLAGGAYTEYTTGISIVGIDVSGKATTTPNGSTFSFEGNARGPEQTEATITTKGVIDPGAAIPVDVSLNLDSARISGGPLESVTASGEFFVKGNFTSLAATGALEIEELNLETVATPSAGLVGINVIDRNAQQDEVARAAATNESITSLDLKITADDKVFVRGRGLESEWTSDLTVAGTSLAPVITGDLRVKSGYILFADRRFEISDGAIAFDRLTINNPSLNIRADTENNDVTAIIAISGRALSPKITLDSSPSLPDNDALAYILFGEPANNLSALEGLQVAQALASLAAIGPFGGGTGVVGSARSSLGVDLLSLDTGSDSESPSLTVGKYVADGLFVSATQDVGGDNSSVRVEYEVRDNITVETELKQNGDQTVSANWKRDF